ncbi:PqiC family protein [Neiella marina]|uniref:PqiC family protein n=1 Tax=Neiella holothuriorum TaxID=2870530 RepID=A0ABS7EEW1_9GAMM|nr:ABC-type transport auxiliary lipoprotein family protein [Neiella holothuriorum]MBW8190463.1 PqiC family protein [Neiella holothuriorum]
MRTLVISATALLSLLLAGCASPPKQANQYSLVASPVGELANVNNDVSGMMEVRRVLVADYLDDPRLMAQVGDNKLLSLPRQRWASPLSRELAALTVETMSHALPQVKVLNGADLEHETMLFDVEVNRFHLISDSQLRVAGRYQIKQANGDYVTGEFLREASFSPGNYDEAVSQMRSIWIEEITKVALTIK